MLLDTDLLIFSLVFQNLHQIGPDSLGSEGEGFTGPPSVEQAMGRWVTWVMGRGMVTHDPLLDYMPRHMHLCSRLMAL